MTQSYRFFIEIPVLNVQKICLKCTILVFVRLRQLYWNDRYTWLCSKKSIFAVEKTKQQ